MTFNEKNQVMGMLQLCLKLNEYLLNYADHIGYSVRPDCRRHGHAIRMLAAELDEANKREIDKVFITCRESSEASRRTIVANGGVLEDKLLTPRDDEPYEHFLDFSVVAR